MTLSRRAFVAASFSATGALASSQLLAAQGPSEDRLGVSRQRRPPIPAQFDPWIEVHADALVHNVRVISRLAGSRPILAVIKNNAYGLGLTDVARILEPLDEIQGFAVVKAAAAIALRDAGVGKPVLLMGLFGDEEGVALAQRGVQLSISTDDSIARVMRVFSGVPSTPDVQVYIDTGMSRMGLPYHRALPILEEAARLAVKVRGTFMAFTEDGDFDREQLKRFTELAQSARARGVELGRLHAASSHGVFNFAQSHLDVVRPGIALYGAYPSDAQSERQIGELRVAVSLKARVVRVEQLRVGDGVSYGRNYVATGPTWIATIPVGHTDGYPRSAVDGGQVMINGRLFPVIGAVSASHTIVELGTEPHAQIGDLVTLLGPDHEAISPNGLAEATGSSVYDILMHLNPGLPKFA